MAEIIGQSIVTNGLICCLDAGNFFSYNGAGNTWVDLSGFGASGTRIGNISFGVGSFIFPASIGTNYFIGGPNTYLDFTMALRPDFTLSNDATLVGLIGVSNNVGNAAPNYREFRGQMGVDFFYNRQLSASEQIQNFNTFRRRFGI